MICNSCGAEFEDDLRKCPYCGSENEVEAYIQHVEMVNEYKNEERRTLELPQKYRRTARRIILLAIMGTIAFVAVLGIILNIRNRIRGEREYEDSKRCTAACDRLYEEGDYDGIVAYGKEYNFIQLGIQKYEEIVLTGQCYQNAADWEESIEESLDRGEASYSFASSMNYLFLTINRCNEYLNDTMDYQNDDGLMYYRKRAVEILEKEFLLSKDEIERFAEKKSDSEDITEAVSISYDRLVGK